MPRAAAAFATDHPGVDLAFIEAEPPEAVRLLRSGEVDVALLFEHPHTAPRQDAALRQVPLLGEPIYLVTPAGTTGDRLVDHAERRWIAGCERCRAHLLRACTTAGFTPEVRFTTDDYVAVQELVAAGLGVTTLPALALLAHRNPQVRVARLPDDRREVTAAVYGAAPDPPPTEALLAHLTAAAAALPTPS